MHKIQLAAMGHQGIEQLDWLFAVETVRFIVRQFCPLFIFAYLLNPRGKLNTIDPEMPLRVLLKGHSNFRPFTQRE